jgi:hypothetical protein
MRRIGTSMPSDRAHQAQAWSAAFIPIVNTKIVGRSLRLNEYLFEAAKQRQLRLLDVSMEESPQVLADRIETLFATTG